MVADGVILPALWERYAVPKQRPVSGIRSERVEGHEDLSVADLRRIALPPATDAARPGNSRATSGLGGASASASRERKKSGATVQPSASAPQFRDDASPFAHVSGSTPHRVPQSATLSPTSSTATPKRRRRKRHCPTESTTRSGACDKDIGRKSIELRTMPSDAAAAGAREGGVPNGSDRAPPAEGAASPTQQRCRRRQNPFAEFEDRGNCRLTEKQTLLEDPTYMAEKLRGLRQAGRALPLQCLEPQGWGGSGITLPRISSGRPRVQHQADSLEQERRMSRNKSAACVKSLQNLQRDLQQSAERVEYAREGGPPPKRNEPRFEDELGIRDLLVAVRAKNADDGCLLWTST
mmetsp:Transcript_59755/g.166835  ORF Transcript_59755/g.166835 Transcript_59755/m.166835 type:complete len:351 (-) Transcript_59755:87-1139(-)